MSNESFTQADAQSLISIAEDAPIPGGAKMAAARAQLYQRFVKFYETVTAKPEEPKPRQRRKAQEQEAVDSPDAEDLTK